MGGATSGEAGQSAMGTLGKGIIGFAQETITGAMGGGIGGMILGPLVGGIVGLGLAKLFGFGNKTVEYETPTLVHVVNMPDPWSPFTLPSSAYFHPTGKNLGPTQFSQYNTMNISGGPKVASRVGSALTDPSLLTSLKRGFG